MPSLEYTAIHEAGHAVTALLLGIPLRDVTVTPGRDLLLGVSYHGRTRIKGQPGAWMKRNPDRAHLFGVYMLAGPEASDLVFAGSTDYYAESGGDVDHALALFGRAGLAASASGARSFVREHWRSIWRVSRALLTHTTLDDVDAAALVPGVPLDPWRRRRAHPPR